ncbi:MAG: peroxide stress protein YaaA, partial [Candidatus Aminicenantes bacterium]
MANALILISCSDEKSTHQETHFKKSTLQNYFTKRNVSNLLERRKSIKNHIQSKRVFDLLIKGEDRSERESNRMLSDGPDFNGSENEPGYLPAYKRYYGRFFNKLKTKHYQTAEKLGYKILILSGLYGFVTPFDSIQNYNCHITDTIINDDSSDSTNSLQKFWVETLTGLIQDFVNKNNISFILDLLSEESYQKSIDWKRIQKVQIRHRIFRNSAGSSILPKMREFFVKDVLEMEPAKLLNFLEPGYPLNRDYFGDDQIVFESEIGGEQGYAREVQKFDKNLYNSLGEKWNILSELDKNALRLSEEIYQKFDQSDYKRQIATAYIQTCWGVLEN